MVIAFSTEGVSADLVRLFCNAVAGGFLFVSFLLPADVPLSDRAVALTVQINRP